MAFSGTHAVRNVKFTYIHTYIHTYARTCVRACVRACVHVCVSLSLSISLSCWALTFGEVESEKLEQAYLWVYR